MGGWRAVGGGWKLGLLPMPYECERLRKLRFPRRSLWRLSGVPDNPVSQTELYALLTAVGCPRLAFLLTAADPRDPLDEELAKWKRWLTQPLRREKGGAPHLAAISEGFLLHASYLEPLEEEVVEGWMGDFAELDARQAVDRELAKLIGLAEAGFEGPEMEGFFDRYVEAVAGLKGWYRDYVHVGEDCSGEEAAALVALGVGEPLPEDPSTLEVRVRGDQWERVNKVLREVTQEWAL